MTMAWHGEKNKHYLWDKIQLRHIFHTAKLAGLSAQIVEEILHEICVSVRGLSDISVEHIPINIAEPILSGVEKRVEMVKGRF